MTARVPEHPEDEAGADRHPPGGHREAQEPRFDAGRGLVARGQRGREAAEPFGRFASGHSGLLPAPCRADLHGGYALCRQPEAYPEGARAECRSRSRTARSVARTLARRVHGRAHGWHRLRQVDGGAMLVERGAVVVDADAIAREVVEPGTPALAALAEAFGPEILRPTGRSTGRRSPARAFVTDEERKRLEAITFPAIGEEFLRQVAAAPPGAIVVHDVPLLVESTRGYDYGAVIVVEAPARAAPAAPRGARRRPCRRRAAYGLAGHRRGTPRGGDLARRQLVGPRPCRGARSTRSGPTSWRAWKRPRSPRPPKPIHPKPSRGRQPTQAQIRRPECSRIAPRRRSGGPDSHPKSSGRSRAAGRSRISTVRPTSTRIVGHGRIGRG